MSTQLRLVDTPVLSRPAARARVRSDAPSRRAANWGEWRLDARTRSVGRAGIAAARRALEEAAACEQLSEAS